MTSQQLKARLTAAIGIIALCECVLADPVRSRRKRYGPAARRAIAGFMDLYRDEQREEGLG